MYHVYIYQDHIKGDPTLPDKRLASFEDEKPANSYMPSNQYLSEAINKGYTHIAYHPDGWIHTDFGHTEYAKKRLVPN